MIWDIKVVKFLVLLAMVIVCISLVIVTYKVLEIFSIPERKPEVGEVYVENRTLVYLPLPKLKGEVSLEEALSMRRSIREYSGKPLSLEVLAQVLWAAQGINEVKRGFRTAPSAGATYPLEVYVVVKEGGVIDLKAGIYHYNVFLHALELVKIGDFSEELAEAALGQRWVRDAMINLIIVAIYDRTTARYGDRGYRYVHMEVGHVGQNIYLQSCVLGLGTVAVGAFHDDQVREILSVPLNYHPLYIMPIGYAKEPYKLSFENLEEFYMEQRSMYGE